MAQPNWTPKLKDVLGYDTKEVTMISPRTGNEYRTEIIPLLKVVATGSVEEIEGKFRYSIVDTTQNLEYSIKVENKVEVKFGTLLIFRNVRGGATNRGGWYASDSVEVVSRNA